MLDQVEQFDGSNKTDHAAVCEVVTDDKEIGPIFHTSTPDEETPVISETGKSVSYSDSYFIGNLTRNTEQPVDHRKQKSKPDITVEVSVSSDSMVQARGNVSKLFTSTVSSDSGNDKPDLRASTLSHEHQLPKLINMPEMYNNLNFLANRYPPVSSFNQQSNSEAQLQGPINSRKPTEHKSNQNSRAEHDSLFGKSSSGIRTTDKHRSDNPAPSALSPQVTTSRTIQSNYPVNSTQTSKQSTPTSTKDSTPIRYNHDGRSPYSMGSIISSTTHSENRPNNQYVSRTVRIDDSVQDKQLLAPSQPSGVAKNHPQRRPLETTQLETRGYENNQASGHYSKGSTERTPVSDQSVLPSRGPVEQFRDQQKNKESQRRQPECNPYQYTQFGAPAPAGWPTANHTEKHQKNTAADRNPQTRMEDNPIPNFNHSKEPMQMNTANAQPSNPYSYQSLMPVKANQGNMAVPRSNPFSTESLLSHPSDNRPQSANRQVEQSAPVQNKVDKEQRYPKEQEYARNKSTNVPYNVNLFASTASNMVMNSPPFMANSSPSFDNTSFTFSLTKNSNLMTNSFNSGQPKGSSVSMNQSHQLPFFLQSNQLAQTQGSTHPGQSMQLAMSQPANVANFYSSSFEPIITSSAASRFSGDQSVTDRQSSQEKSRNKKSGKPSPDYSKGGLLTYGLQPRVDSHSYMPFHPSPRMVENPSASAPQDFFSTPSLYSRPAGSLPLPFQAGELAGLPPRSSSYSHPNLNITQQQFHINSMFKETDAFKNPNAASMYPAAPHAMYSNPMSFNNLLSHGATGFDVGRPPGMPGFPPSAAGFGLPRSTLESFRMPDH